MDIKLNWSLYLKIAGVALAIIVWAVATQTKLDNHISETRDTIKLLMLICKNTSPKPIDQLDCYAALDTPRSR